MQREDLQKQWYREYDRKAGRHRNDIRLNPGVMFQVLAAEKAFVLAVRQINHPPALARVLDVGSGEGGNIYQYLRLGYLPENITGIEIQKELVGNAQSLYPSINFMHADASKIDIEDCSFDIVAESTMFATLVDDEVSSKIASEMLRVCKPGGYILLADWRTPKPGDLSYKALTRSRLSALFKLGNETFLLGVYRGSLVPPVGRFLSAYFPSLYFMVASLFPFLVGEVVYLLQKQHK